MKIALLLMLTVFVACNDVPDDETVIRDDVCGDKSASCLLQPHWVVNSTSVNFPPKFTVAINGSDIFSTCTNPTAATTSTQSGRSLIAFKHQYVPQNKLKLDIYDHGIYCDKRAIFFSDDEVNWNIVTLATGSKQINVVLDN